jgi:hypothetical protein
MILSLVVKHLWSNAALSFRAHERVVAVLRHGRFLIVISTHSLRIYQSVGGSVVEVALAHTSPDIDTEGEFRGGATLADVSAIDPDYLNADEGLAFAVYVRPTLVQVILSPQHPCIKMY